MPTVYVSHPIKGLTDNQVSALESKGARWANHRDFTYILPRNLKAGCELTGEPPCVPDESAGEGAAHTHACYMKGDLLAMLMQATHILLMPGWEKSAGCKAELNTALAAGIGVEIFNPFTENL